MENLKNLKVIELNNQELKSHNGGGLAIFLLFFDLGYRVERYKETGVF